MAWVDRGEDHDRWAKQVKERDGYTCRVCNKYGVYLHSHHLNSYDMFIEQRYDINNGVTLCHTCHKSLHFIFGSGRNTKFQFQQFVKTYNLMRSIISKQGK